MKIIKIALFSALALVLLIAVSLAILLHFLDPNRQQAKLARLVQEKTGRELKIEGELSWGIWPRLHLAGGPITLSDAQGFGPEPMLRLESFAISVATWPLLRREVIIDTATIAGLRLNLARNQAGVGNWQDLAADSSAPPTDKTAKPGASGSLPFATLILGGVEIKEVEINWHDAVSGRKSQLREFNLKTDPLRFGDPVPLHLSFTVADNQPVLEAKASLATTLLYDLAADRYAAQALTATVNLSGLTVPGGRAPLTMNGEFTLDRKAGAAKLEQLRLEGLGTLISGQLALADLNQPQPSGQGQIKLEIADLVRLLAIFESPLAQQLSGVRERMVSLDTEFNVVPGQGKLNLPRMEARLLGALITGNLEASEVNSRQPRVKGGLKAEIPDLPALLAVASRLCPTATPQALASALASLKERGGRLEAAFASEGAEVVIPRLYLQGLTTRLESDWRLGNLAAPKPTLAGKIDLAGDDLVLLLKVADAFKGTPQSRPAGPAPFAAVGRIEADLQKGEARASDFRIKALDLEAKLGLTAAKLNSTPEFELALSLAPFNLRRLMNLLAIPVPSTRDDKALTSLALETTISGSPEKFRFKPLDLRLDGSRLQGEVAINDLNRPDLAFRLTLDQLDLDRYLPPESKQAPPTPEAAAAGVAILPVEQLRRLRLDGELKAGSLKISGLRLENLLFGIKAADGRISARPLDAALYGGKMNGGMAIDATGPQPTITSENRLSGIQIGPLLRDLTGQKEKLRGRADLDYQLATSGNQTPALKANLNGEAKFNLADGAVVGVNIGRLLRQASALFQGRTLAAEEQEVATDFASLTGSAQIKNGLVSNRDLSLLSPLLRVSGEGTANLVSEEVNYLLTTTVVATSKGQGGAELDLLRGIAIPIRVSGTFSNLSYRPDLGAAGLNKLKDTVRQEGRKILEGILGGGQEKAPATEPAPKPATPEEKLQEGLRKLFR